MQRRAFLASATVAAGALGLSTGPARAAAAQASQLQLWSSTSAERGASYRPHGAQACADCSAAELEFHIDGLFPAASESVFERLSAHALFDLPEGGTVPFHAWQFSTQPLVSSSGPVQFVAGRASMRRLQIEYRLLSDDQAQLEEFSLARLESALLSPGHYVLLSPRQNGASLAGLKLQHSGDPLAPLSGLAGRDFDYFAFRMQPAA